MPRARIRFVVVFAASLVAAVMLAPYALAKPLVKKCPPISVGGHVYYVSTTHTVCSFAEKWVAKLAGGRLAAHSSNVALSNGPKGFTCQAGTKGSGADMPRARPRSLLQLGCEEQVLTRACDSGDS